MVIPHDETPPKSLLSTLISAAASMDPRDRQIAISGRFAAVYRVADTAVINGRRMAGMAKE
jgi:hypothetical protein